MNKKYLAIIVVAAVLVVALAASYFVLNQQPHYKNITMNGITMEVPEGNSTVVQQSEFFSLYNDTEKNMVAMVFDSTNAGLSDLAEAVVFAGVRDVLQANATQQTSDGVTYNYSQTNKIYTYVGNYSHKNLFIATKDKEDMIHALQTINVDEEISLNQTNQTNQTKQNVATTQSTSKSTSDEKSVEREDEQVIDGWDPKEHEVSRERVDDNMEKVYYDDDYFRMVDNNGKVVSYGYG